MSDTYCSVCRKLVNMNTPGGQVVVRSQGNEYLHGHCYERHVRHYRRVEERA